MGKFGFVHECSGETEQHFWFETWEYIFKANLSFTNHYLWERSGALPHVSWIYVSRILSLWIHASWINAYCIMDTCIINTSVWVTQLELSKTITAFNRDSSPRSSLCWSIEKICTARVHFMNRKGLQLRFICNRSCKAHLHSYGWQKGFQLRFIFSTLLAKLCVSFLWRPRSPIDSIQGWASQSICPT